MRRKGRLVVVGENPYGPWWNVGRTPVLRLVRERPWSQRRCEGDGGGGGVAKELMGSGRAEWGGIRAERTPCRC